MQRDRYSRMVALLKVLLPLMALALLSTLFLLSRVIDPTASIPFADTEIQDRLRGQQVTGPFFSGTSADGDQMSFSARLMTTRDGTTGASEARDVAARFDLASGARITLNSDRGTFDLVQDQTRMDGSVVITTSTGYVIRTEALHAQMSGLDVRSPVPVTATGPIGDLAAGEMRIFAPAPNADTQLFFTNGVKLLYQPKQPKD